MRWKPLVAVAVLVAGVATARLTVFDPVRVTSGSMAPTVCTGDVVVVYHLGPSRGVRVDDIESTAKTMPGFTRMWADMLAGRS